MATGHADRTYTGTHSSDPNLRLIYLIHTAAVHRGANGNVGGRKPKTPGVTLPKAMHRYIELFMC